MSMCSSLRTLSRSTATFCLLGLLSAPLATAQDADRVAAQFDRVDDVAFDEVLGTPAFIAGALRAPSKADPATIAITFLAERSDLLRTSGRVGFAVTRVENDAAFKSSHVRLMQEVDGVPVFGAESIVHIDRSGAVYAFSGTVHPGIGEVATTPALTDRAALAAAKRWLPAGTVLAVDAVEMPEDGPLEAAPVLAPTVRLVVYPEQQDERVTGYRLAYHADLQTASPEVARWQVFVDAETGKVFHYFNAIHTATSRDVAADYQGAEAALSMAIAPAQSLVAVDGPTTGSGSSLYSGTRSLNTYLSQGRYYLYDTRRANSYIRTMRATNGGRSYPGSYVTDGNNNFNASNQRAAVDVHWGVGQTFDYFYNTHSRNSFDNRGAAVTSSINAVFWTGSGYTANNASWTGSQMLYGDGDGSRFGPLVDLDITAHELTHAVTDYTADLIYQNASGALNEAVSDIFAVMVDRDDWRVGERSYTPGVSGDALRSLSNPPEGGQPDNYAARYTGSEDNGGVHINSGIFNKAAYLMAAGGTFRGVSVGSIGRSRTERIWYRALTRYFGRSTGYSGARSGVLSATRDLYGSGSSTYRSVQNAFAAVGIGSPALQGDGDTGRSEHASLGQEVPTVLALKSLYPNPTAGTATVAYALPQSGAVEIAAYDVLGREVVRVEDAQVEAGTHEVTLDASRLPAGLYVVHLRAGDEVATARLTVTR